LAAWQKEVVMAAVSPFLIEDVVTYHRASGTALDLEACNLETQEIVDPLLRKIWNEYVEMPGLRLTLEQAQRLWALDARSCTSLLDRLVEARFLVHGADGMYGRLSVGRNIEGAHRLEDGEALMLVELT
jgi:hypothetical protein